MSTGTCTRNQNATTSLLLLDSLEISPFLRARIHERIPCCEWKGRGEQGAVPKDTKDSSSFILYVPTVLLRIDQNPAFALACHIANYLQLPLIVLAVLLDDHSHHCLPYTQTQTSSCRTKQVTMTARRLAFLTEALSQSAQEWSNHGAGVAIRVHKDKGRIPDHLTLASRATTVVTDEPFVHPFLHFVSTIETVCHKRNIPCFRVDGSTTVPPISVLKRNNYCYSMESSQSTINSNSNSNTTTSSTSTTSGSTSTHPNNKTDNLIYYHGVPSKAWIWQKQTESLRHDQVQAAMTGHFDAPPLDSKLKIENDDFFILSSSTSSQHDYQYKHGHIHGHEHEHGHKSDGTFRISPLLFPLHWRNKDNEAPGIRPWTVTELVNIAKMKNHYNTIQHNDTNYTPIKQWAMEWPGADSTVKPCLQTIGTNKAGMQRWNHWVTQRKGLVYYAKKRTDPLQPHASSRMSCYLNFGIVSIFRIVHEVKVAQRSNVAGADKFEEEIVKWREMSYAHAFSRGDYNSKNVVPMWAQKYIIDKYETTQRQNVHLYDLNQLENYNSDDETWNAMQRYLVCTGELHNNARMTWGKKIVHWSHANNCHNNNNNNNLESHMWLDPISNLLHVLCYLNDRFALDGLAPPSYAGLLWCLGWTDKPDRNGAISTKRSYKLSPQGFLDAERNLMHEKKAHGSLEQTSILSRFSSTTTTTTSPSTQSGMNVSKRGYDALNDEKYTDIANQHQKKRVSISDKKTLYDFFSQK